MGVMMRSLRKRVCGFATSAMMFAFGAISQAQALQQTNDPPLRIQAPMPSDAEALKGAQYLVGLEAAIFADGSPADEPLVNEMRHFARMNADNPIVRELGWRTARDQFWRRVGADRRMLERAGGNLQAARDALQQWVFSVEHEVDGSDTAWLRDQIKVSGGWFRISKVGETGGALAWILVQHADRAPEFQRQVLDLMEPLVAEGEVSKSNYAYLYDRVAWHEGRPSRYGTQGGCTGPGQWEPFANEDASKVDARRAEMGIEPLADYVARASVGCP
jgi:hypothetical protein